MYLIEKFSTVTFFTYSRDVSNKDVEDRTTGESIDIMI